MQRLLAQLALGMGSARRYRTRGTDEADEGPLEEESGMARAVFNGDLATVAQLLLRGADVNAPDRYVVIASEVQPRAGGRALTARPPAAASGRCCWRCCATRALTWRSCCWRRGPTSAAPTATGSPACTGWRSGTTMPTCWHRWSCSWRAVAPTLRRGKAYTVRPVSRHACVTHHLPSRARATPERWFPLLHTAQALRRWRGPAGTAVPARQRRCWQRALTGRRPTRSAARRTTGR